MRYKIFLISCLFIFFLVGCRESSDTKITPSYTKLVVGDGYAAYIDETSNLHILYDDTGATEGVDLSKKYKGLGDDRTYLVTIDSNGNVWTAYPYTADEVEEQLEDLFKDVAEHGGTMGTGIRNPFLMRNFGMLTNVQQIVSDYPYSYLVLSENGSLQNSEGFVYESLNGVSQFAEDANGVIATMDEDGILTFFNADVLREKKFESWTGKFQCIHAGNYFVGLKEDGTVLAEDVELNDLINNVEQWKDIQNLAVAEDTVIGLKKDGTVVAVCKTGTNQDQCEVEEWKDIIAIGTNGKVTIGIRKDGSVVFSCCRNSNSFYKK